MGFVTIGAGAVIAALVLLHRWITYRLEVQEIERDFAWHVMWRERIWGEWRSDADG